VLTIVADNGTEGLAAMAGQPRMRHSRTQTLAADASSSLFLADGFPRSQVTTGIISPLPVTNS
jgi:hypothetical protein